jgi:hypothetical protein
MGTHREYGIRLTRYAVRGASGRSWEQHLPTLRQARRSAAHVRGEGFGNVFVVEERTGRVVSRGHHRRSIDETDDYSVRLCGMAVWEDHLHSVAAARQSADESRGMGLSDVHIVDDTTGEVLE